MQDVYASTLHLFDNVPWLLYLKDDALFGQEIGKGKLIPCASVHC